MWSESYVWHIWYIYLQNKKLLVRFVFSHGSMSSVSVGDVVSLDVHLHLKLLQIQQHLEPLCVVLPVQGTLQYGSLRHTYEKQMTLYTANHITEAELRLEDLSRSHQFLNCWSLLFVTKITQKLPSLNFMKNWAISHTNLGQSQENEMTCFPQSPFLTYSKQQCLLEGLSLLEILDMQGKLDIMPTF